MLTIAGPSANKFELTMCKRFYRVGACKMLVMVDFFLYGRWARMLGIMAGIKSGGGRTEKSGKK